MASGVRIARVSGIPIRAGWGLVVLAGLFGVTLTGQVLPRFEPEASLATRSAVAAVTVVLLLGSILAHEFGHAVAARRRGVGVLGITLSLLGGYATLERQAPNPGAEFSIAAAGPLVNAVLAVVLGGAAWGLDRWLPETWVATALIVGAAAWLAIINAILAVINLVPAAPLDGGRVLTAALWKRLGDAEWARIISARIGMVLGAVLLVGGAVQLFWDWRGLVTVVVGGFLVTGARSEILTAAIRRRLASTRTEQVMATELPAVPDSLTLEQLQRFAGAGRANLAFPVVRWDAEPIGYVIPADGGRLPPAERTWTRVTELMRSSPTVARAWTEESVDTVLRRLTDAGGSGEALVVVVHEPRHGQPVGTVTTHQIDPLFQPPDAWGRDRPAAVTPTPDPAAAAGPVGAAPTGAAAPLR
jgi:Zn-dependent protease